MTVYYYYLRSAVYAEMSLQCVQERVSGPFSELSLVRLHPGTIFVEDRFSVSSGRLRQGFTCGALPSEVSDLNLMCFSRDFHSNHTNSHSSCSPPFEQPHNIC